MKRIFMLMCLAVLVALAARAEHFTFMGIPLDGDPDTFETSLIQKGFTPDGDHDEYHNTRFYRGQFYDDKTALVTVFATPKSNVVTMVAVTFEDDTKPERTKARFERIQKVVEKKYDTATKEEVKADRDVYYHISREGSIRLLDSDGLLIMYYIDGENADLYSTEQEEDI